MNLPAGSNDQQATGARAHTHGHTIVARGKVRRSRSSMGERFKGRRWAEIHATEWRVAWRWRCVTWRDVECSVVVA